MLIVVDARAVLQVEEQLWLFFHSDSVRLNYVVN